MDQELTASDILSLVRSGNVKLVKKVSSEHLLDLRATSELYENVTVFELCCIHGHYDLLQYVLDFIPNGFTEEIKRECIKYAIETERARMIPLLIPCSKEEPKDWKLDLEICGGQLHLACCSGNLEIVTYFVEKLSYSLHTSDDEEWNCATFAAAYGSLSVLSYLSKKDKTCTQTRDINGNNILMVACSFGHLEIVHYLLEQGFDYNLRNMEGKNSLLLSLEMSSSEEIAILLLESGCDTLAVSTEGETCLMFAIQEKCFRAVNILIEKNSHLDLQDTDGNTSLMYACEKGYLDIAKSLINAGCIIHRRNKEGRMAITLAAINGHLELVQYLVELNPFECEDEDSEMSSALSTIGDAVIGGNLDVVKCLLGKCPEVKEEEFGWDGDFGDFKSLCMLACYHNHLEIAKYLTKKGFLFWDEKESFFEDVIATGNIELVTLFIVETRMDLSVYDMIYAIQHGDVNILHFLAEKRGDVPFQKNKHKFNFLIVAASESNLDVVKYWLGAGYPMVSQTNNAESSIWNTTNQYKSVLSAAIFSGNLDIALHLLEQGYPPQVDKIGFMFAKCCLLGGLEIVKTLIDKGFSLSLGGKEGLFVANAISSGNMDLIEYLLMMGCSVHDDGHFLIESVITSSAINEEQRGDLTRTLLKKGCPTIHVNSAPDTVPILTLAAHHGRKSVCSALIEFGVSMEKHNGSGITSFLSACIRGHREVAMYLMEKGCSIHVKRNDNFTPLMAVCSNGDLEMVKHLLTKGCSLTEIDNDNASCLFYALSNKHIGIAMKLIQHDCAITGSVLRRYPLCMQYTCLAFAVELRSLPVVQYVVSKSLSLCGTTQLMNAASISIQKEYFEILEYFVVEELINEDEIVTLFTAISTPRKCDEFISSFKRKKRIKRAKH